MHNISIKNYRQIDGGCWKVKMGYNLMLEDLLTYSSNPKLLPCPFCQKHYHYVSHANYYENFKYGGIFG
jgi:hypothetical protein